MKKMVFASVLCLLLIGLMGTVAYAGNLDWKTTKVGVQSDNVIYVQGYFTNNRTDRVVTRINWFQPNVTLTYPNGYRAFIDENTGSQDCYIEPGCTYEMTFYVNNPDGRGFTYWHTNPKFNFHYENI